MCDELRGTQFFLLPHRVASGMSGTNPKPRDLNNAVVVMDGDEMRLRRADEATEAGKETEHHMFILCVNIGVRCGLHLHSTCTSAC